MMNIFQLTIKDFRVYVLALLVLASLLPGVSAGMALLGGAVLGLTLGNPLPP
ncbi:MAG: hypothetical protein LRY54_00080 [Alphaproteobacteria bacterium]|nr:hypothetical protein [Alphaproteobacteria bacterium]